jgi:hypothetical protein
MEKNPNPTTPTSIDAQEVEEPQDRHRSENSPKEAGPVSVDELLSGDAAADAGPEVPPVDFRRAASILESLLLVSSEPLSVKRPATLGELTREQFEEVFLLLREKYPPASSGSS